MIFELMDNLKKVKENKNAKAANFYTGKIQFKNVSFSYDEG